MKAKAYQIDDSTWRFEEESVRFFLLAGSDRALLIDSGMQTHHAKELAEELTDLPLCLLNTHADPDHIGSNHEFAWFYMSPAECANYYRAQGRSGNVVPVWDGERLDLGNRPLQIFALPGHTPGSIAVLDEKSRRLFSGDPIQDGRIFMFGPQREMHAYLHSLRRLQKELDRFDEIYPSHGTCPVKPSLIQTLQQAAQQLLDGNIEGRCEEAFGHPVIAYDAGAAIFLCDADERPNHRRKDETR